MYCVYCGVELQKGAKACPLCGTAVCCPAPEESVETAPYPPYREKSGTVKRMALQGIITALFVVPMVICLLIDLRLHGHVAWSGYVIGGILVAYLALCLPRWFRSPNPVIFFPCAMVGAMLFLLYICLHNGGRWFLTLAFPLGGIVLAVVECVIVLMRYVVRGVPSRGFLVVGSAVIAFGLLMPLLEFLIRLTFGFTMQWWSLIPLVSLAFLGGLLLVIGLCRPLRESLHKKLFL